MLRRYPQVEALRYDPTSDSVTLLGGYKGVAPVVGVRKVILEAGAASLNDVQSFERIDVGPGCIVKGNLASCFEIAIEKGPEDPTLIVGDVTALKLSEESSAETLVHTIGEGRAFIKGNFVASRIKITSGVIVVGDVVAFKKAEIEGPALVLGRVIAGTESVEGELRIRNATVFQAYASGSMYIGEGVTLLSPIALVKGGEVYWDSGRAVAFSHAGETAVRVFGLPCLLCSETQNPLLCSKQVSGGCKRYEALKSYDCVKSPDGDYTVLSWYWRASPSMILQNLIAKRIFRTSRLKLVERVDMTGRTVDGVPLRDYPETFLNSLIEDLRSVTGEYSEAAKKIIFEVFEEYMKARMVEYRRCSVCGAPNPATAKVCFYCCSRQGG
ncbi:MAG: zinc ribbon domain-containing protein [Thermofilaceae archaeon]